MSSGKLFDFSVVSVEIFHKYIDNLDVKKAIGHDGLNAKFLKLCGFHIAKPYCALFNQCVSKSIYVIGRVWTWHHTRSHALAIHTTYKGSMTCICVKQQDSGYISKAYIYTNK